MNEIKSLNRVKLWTVLHVIPGWRCTVSKSEFSKLSKNSQQLQCNPVTNIYVYIHRHTYVRAAEKSTGMMTNHKKHTLQSESTVQHSSKFYNFSGHGNKISQTWRQG